MGHHTKVGTTIQANIVINIRMRLRHLLTELSRPPTMETANQVLQAAGWKRLGRGEYGTVFGRDDKDYVVKIFEDPGYLHYLNLILQRPNRHFPVIKGKPTKINNVTWAVRLEKLEPLEESNLRLHTYASSYLSQFIALAYAEQELYRGYSSGGDPRLGDAWRSPNDRRINYEPTTRLRQNLMPFEQNYQSLAEALRIVATNLLIPNDFSADLHDENCMQRGVTLVITDPIAESMIPPEKIVPKQRSQLELPMSKQPTSWWKQKHLSDYLGDYRELSNRSPIPKHNISDPYVEPTLPGSDTAKPLPQRRSWM